MKEAIVSKGPTVKIVDSAIPKAEPGQVVIKVVVSGSNPKDWKVPDWSPDSPPMNQGDDIAGIVHEVGEGVEEFKKGDRVAAFHEMMKPGGSYAEYAVAWAHTTFLLPGKARFEEGAALPLAYLTAVVGLYASDRLNLPHPFSPATEPIPLVVYGGSSAVGSYVIQLAQKSNIHPIIAVAGRAQEHVEKMIDRSKGDTIVDYRKGDDAVVQGIKDALKDQKLYHAYDAVSEKNSYVNISKVLEEQGGATTFVLPPLGSWTGKHKEFAATVKQTTTNVGAVHGPLKDLGFVYSRYLTRALQEGWFKAQPQEVVPGGLEGVQGALEKLKDGTASAVKYVFRIADTPGVGQ
ncbi:GroES-like protein [Teratosphaeria nubilosa]|uniref:GroES-like protein n=1 Tax=Teratosphaeria nubilosa TaxID=161662 RepID=A0A6G1L185_9PEZI|nr:GroES-like protein [Teratosphaeria nubilosa]